MVGRLKDARLAKEPSQDVSRSPRICIGLPVYNGEDYIRGGIASILRQTFRDFELIISDNASTDRTAAICREFAARDERIRYHRQPHNLGAAANFNRSYEMATGEYFKWAAHDDLLEPEYLAKCIAALDAAPEAILCQSLVEIVDDQNRVLEVCRPIGAGADSPRPSVRLAARLRQRRCLDVFGVIRTEALRDSIMLGDHIGSDRTLLSELALRGAFVLVDEPLLINREHPRRATRLGRTRGRKELAAWFNPRSAHRSKFSTWISFGAHARLIWRYVPGLGERLRCYGHLLASLRRRSNWALLLLEPVMVLDPRVLSWAKAFKRTLGRAPSVVRGKT
jgi:glycosyltransferase involved in cell wall biosynthesis